MNDSLIPYEHALPHFGEEAIARQFRDWERRGRGWQVYDFPVAIEPPFRPFSFFMPDERLFIDDGQVSTFFSRLVEGSSSRPKQDLPGDTSEIERYARYQEYIAETDEPDYCSDANQSFIEVRLLVPKELKSSGASFKQFILSLSYLAHPIGFEIIGNSDQVVIQCSVSPTDLAQTTQQMGAHFPDCRLKILDDLDEDFLSANWINGAAVPFIVDFGLSREYVLPLQTISNFEVDPLAVVMAAMSDLEDGETAVLQILFQRCRSNWAHEFLDTINCFEDTELFDYLPDIKHQAKQKFASLLFAAIIRIGAKSDYQDRSMEIARNIAGAFTRLSNPWGNELIPLSNDGYDIDHHERGLLNRQSFRTGMLLNVDELVSLVHLPTSTAFSNKLIRGTDRTKAIPNIAKGSLLVLGQNSHFGNTAPVSLSDDQRTRHVHVIGASGSGKTTLLLNLIKQDMESGQGLCVIDPHGDLIDEAIGHVPDSRIDDVILFDPSDSEYPIGFNLFDAKTELERTILSSDLVSAFRRMSTSWGDVMDAVLANAVLAILENSKGGTLLDLKRFLVEKSFRDEFLKSSGDDSIRYFWTHEFPLIANKPQASILIRLDTFLRQKLIRNIVCQKETKLDFREVMDAKKILFIKLSQGLIGEENSHLLGTLLISKLYQTALSRQDSRHRPYFWVYMDEFQNFITPSMENILAGSRKYNLGLILAHQEFRQMQSRSPEVASSVLSNCYTRICFRLGDSDAEKLAGGFSFFEATDLTNLGIGEAIARVERSGFDFNINIERLAKTNENTATDRLQKVREMSRSRFAMPRERIETQFRSDLERVSAIAEKAQETKDAALQNKSLLSKARKYECSQKNEQAKTAINGNAEHRYLQNTIKRIGESKGYISTIEKSVFGGIGKVDVALENESFKIACEIAVTNSTEYETQNIQKCLTAGFDKVAVISSDMRHLGNIRIRAELVLSPVFMARVHFLEPENFDLFLDSLAHDNTGSPSTIGEEGKVKGYRVDMRRSESSIEEKISKKKIIIDVLAGVMKRIKKGIDGAGS